jgi:hypothetical protein
MKRPTIVLRANSPRPVSIEALDVSYLDLARLRTARMGELYGATPASCVSYETSANSTPPLMHKGRGRMKVRAIVSPR